MKKLGALAGMVVRIWPGEVALDHRQGREQGEAEAERDHQPAGLGAGAVEVGEREPEHRVAADAAGATRSSGSARRAG